MMEGSSTPELAPPSPASGLNQELHCPACHYNLFGNVSGKCPECGLSFTLETLLESKIPWEQRRKIGRWKAYWRTVGLVLFQPRRFSREVCRPVAFADANGFRWLNVFLASVPGLAMTYILFQIASGGPLEQIQGLGGEIAILSAFLSGWLLFLVMNSTMPFFWGATAPGNDPYRQRVKAFSLYASAVLVMIPLSFGLFLVTEYALALIGGSVIAGEYLGVNAGWFLTVVVIWSWVVNILLFRHVTQAFPGRIGVLAVLLPLTWFLSGLVLLIGLPGLFVILLMLLPRG